MDRLALVPSVSGYSAKPGKSYGRTALSGGPGRYRADAVNISAQFTCTWELDQGDYDYMAAFYRRFARLVQPFIITLILKDSAAEDYIAYIIDDSWSLVSQVGLSYTVKCDIEAWPLIMADDEYDDSLVDIRGEYASMQDMWDAINQLRIFTTIDMPTNLG